MIKKISVLAGVAAIPFILGGCGSSDESSITLQNVQGLNVKFADNSADLTDRPFYLIGTKAMVGINGTFNGVASPVSTIVAPATFTTKDLTKVTLTFTGSIVGASATRPQFYQLEIRARNTNGFAVTPVVETPGVTQDLVYSVGFAKDVNNTLFTFDPVAGPVNAASGNVVEVWISSLNPAVTGSVRDFTVNVPTAAGTTLAPYTGTTGTTSLALGTLVTDNATKAQGGRSQLSTSTLLVDAAYNIAVPWQTGTPLAYWKSGFGLVECVARYYWLKNNTGVAAAADTFGSAPGSSNGTTFVNADYSVNPVDPNALRFTAPATATPQPTTSVFGPLETGFFDPAAKLPRGTN